LAGTIDHDSSAFSEVLLAFLHDDDDDDRDDHDDDTRSFGPYTI
jgi:hypothetical protein